MKNFFFSIWHNIWPFSPIEIILAIFALFAWSRAFLRFRAKSINHKEFTFWSIVWFATIVIVFIHGKTTILAKLLGMGRGFDAMVFLAIIGLFYIVYRLYVKINEIEIETTELVRQIALHLGIQKSAKKQKTKK